jgi:DHA2 family multidrug resistance protein
MVLVGLILFSTMALLTPFLQRLLGYPILDAGNMIAARGVGTFFAMMIAGRMLQIIEARTLIFTGFALNAISLYQMAGFTEQTGPLAIFSSGVIAGFGLGLIFVPLNSVAFLTLAGHLRTAGTSLLTLIRNVASSIGISLAIAALTNTTNAMHARLAENVTPFNNALQMPSAEMLNPATEQGRALLDQMLTQQATVLGFNNVFLMLMWVCIIATPFVFFIGSSRETIRRARLAPQPPQPQMAD